MSAANARPPAPRSPEPFAPPKRLLVLAPLRLEARAAREGAPWARVEQIGMGPRRARRAAEITQREQGGPTLIAGFCGALDPTLQPGDVVLATELRGPMGTTQCPDPAILAGILRRGGLRVHLGPIASSQRLVVRERRRALHRTGALAVDMESAWLAPEANADPLVTLRVVLDTAERELNRPLATLSGARTAYRTLRHACALAEEWARALGRRDVLLAAPRASCAGVVRAVQVVERALDEHELPVYVRKQIVHNQRVVAELEQRGAVFVDELAEVPSGATVVFSAHGVSPAVRQEAQERGLDVIDATCPLVAKVHAEARHFAEAGLDIVLIGHEGHEEVEGTVGEAPDRTQIVTSPEDVEQLKVADASRVAYLTQTTLAVDETAGVVDALRDRFPALVGPASDDICYATQNRQDAVRALAPQVDAILVVGSRNSSNSRRLVEVAERAGVRAALVDNPTDVPLDLLTSARRIGITAGASAPEALVQEVVSALDGLGGATVSEVEVAREDVHFKLPPSRPESRS
ncbi:MAG TPA: 4-hydroxy-3-methylbut-2-enyl diphosphate reductase [Conexibacter sp.]